MTNKIIILKFPITCDDLKATNDTFGTRIKALKVKTVQLDIEIIPAGVLDRYMNVTMSDDIMFVNKIIFLLQYPDKYSLEPQKSSLTQRPAH